MKGVSTHLYYCLLTAKKNKENSCHVSCNAYKEMQIKLSAVSNTNNINTHAADFDKGCVPLILSSVDGKENAYIKMEIKLTAIE